MPGIAGLNFVITGGAKGIGAATARLAADRGARVVVADVLDDEGHLVVEGITATGGVAQFVHCDVTVIEQIELLMRAADEAFGGIDVVHNNAGITESVYSDNVTIDTLPQEAWDAVMDLNVRGTWLCSRAALPYLRESGRGSIINAGSTASLTGYPFRVAYGTSKAAIVGLTRNLAVALAPDGIRVNCYCPSVTRTDLPLRAMARLPEGTDMTPTHLIPRMAEPEEIAEIVCFLASDEARFVNGAIWTVDGGATAWRGTRDQLPAGVGFKQ